jgi:tetratricopeptide (TPR) repeat protein
MTTAGTLDTQTLLRQAGEHHRQGRHAEAIDGFRQALALNADLPEAWDELAYVLKAEGRYAEAVEAFGQAIARGHPRAAEAHLNRAVLFADHLRRDAAAEAELRAALALRPRYLAAALNLGNLHEQRGAREEALACYRQILADTGDWSREDAQLRWVALARAAIIQPPKDREDPLLQRLHAAIADVGGEPLVRANLLYALGQAHDGLGDTDRAFEAFALANRNLLRRAGRRYDPVAAQQLTDALIGAFPARIEGSEYALSGPAPLFVCGMFRSGSTLIEQVLAAHPQVVAGGEIDWLLRTATERLAPFPASMPALSAAQAGALAAEYHQHLAGLFPAAADARYITDKRPDNYLLIGFIKRLFPTARIVHTIRDPIDTGLSVFMQHLNLEVAAYAADLSDIGHHIGEYRRLMAHWKALYSDTIVDFDYDRFVAEPRATLTELLAFLGLPWDERCLAFHELRNTVKTASYWQVRQPLNTRGRGRWKRYRTHLEPLIQALRAAGVETAADA